MADIELVVKIDEKDYQSLKDGHIPFNVLDVIANGALLDNIKAEISEKKANSGTIAHKVAYSNCLEIIDKHTSGGDTK